LHFRYNSGDVEAVMALMAEDVAYHDLALYQEPFRGKEAVRAYFEKVTATVPGDLKFTLEHITSGDPNAAGVRW
jgi:ketosteroid isomerase-like protein